MLPELRDLGRDHHLAMGLPAVQLEILLVIILGLVEGLEWRELCHDLPIPNFRGGDFLDYLLGHGLLFVVAIKDHRPVLRADIVSLSVQCGGVMHGKEDFQNCL